MPVHIEVVKSRPDPHRFEAGIEVHDCIALYDGRAGIAGKVGEGLIHRHQQQKMSVVHGNKIMMHTKCLEVVASGR